MFIHINEAEREQYGRFSLKGIKATYRNPESYFATTITEFLNYQSEIEGTRFKILNPLLHPNQVLVLLPACYYSRIDHSGNIKETRRGEKSRRELATLYDASGNDLMVRSYCPEIPNGASIEMPVLLYNLNIDFCTLLTYDKKNNKPPQQEKKTLGDIINNLIPQPSGA